MLREMQWQQWNLSNQGLILLVSLFVCATPQTLREPLQRRGETARKTAEI
jgi:hypothetical protein